MKIEISVEELRKRSLMVLVPMYGGMCTGVFNQGMMDLMQKATHLGLTVVVKSIYNESLIARARNYLFADFLDSDCTHCLFIDADIGFSADDVLTLLALQDEDSPYDILAAPYPKKTIAWEKVVAAVNQGVADQDANELSNYVGDFVLNFPPGTTQVDLNQPVEVLETGTGFMMIKKSTGMKMARAYPETKYLPDHVRSPGFDGSREIYALFDCIIDPATRRYLSEDYLFCQRARNVGLKTYVCPWINLKHMGSYIFGGTMHHLASIGQNVTADISKLGKAK